MTTTLIRRTGAIALSVAATVSLTGCVGVLGARMTYNDTEQAKITDIVISGNSGDVLIRAAAVTQTSIKRVIRRSSNPEQSFSVNGGTLNIDTSCGANCTVSYEITAPAGVAVRGELSSGDIELDGVGATDIRVSSGDLVVKNATGPVQASSGSGDIEVSDTKATVTARATSGDIHAVNVAGAVDAKATTGDLDIRLASTNSVTAEATSGDVKVTVPPGSYQISANTGSGDKSLHNLTNDAAAPNLINVKTGSGDVTVSAAS